MEFIQPNEQRRFISELPSVAIDFNGFLLDEVSSNYRTLKVSGRETISTELELTNVQEGTLTTNSRLPHRELVVTYQITSESNEQFQDDYKRLRRLLTSHEEVPVQFQDEPDRVYFGRLSAMEVPTDDSNSVMSTFSIHCDSPYKYGELEVTNGNVSINTYYETTPEQIEVTIDETTNKLEVTNGDYAISATGTFNTGVEVVFYFDKEEMYMTVDGVESTYMIDLNSDLENFTLQQGQTVSSPHGELTLTMRERWL